LSPIAARRFAGATPLSAIDRAIAPATVLKAKGRQRVMFLFRMLFWLGLAVLLLPTDENQQAKLSETASATVERIATFCDRNGKACAAGAEFWSTFLKKAEFGARVAADLITSRGQRSEGVAQTSAPRPNGPAAAEPRPTPASRNTLNRDALGPTWRAPPPRAGA
jgi:Family of unknown function (DUF5330)